MRATVIVDGRLEVQERPDPVPGEGQVLLRVRAAGINGADMSQVAGRYPPPPGTPVDIPGLECAGETEDGRRLMALLPGAGQAELVAVDESHTLPVPDDLTWEQAGGFMEVFATAHDALFSQAMLHDGERLLVNGAAGGVGVAAVQLGIAAGAQVTASARHHHEELRALGADTDVEGDYDVILELVGGDNLSANLDRLATKGRIVVVGMGAGSRAEIEFGKLMGKRGRIFGTMLRFRSGGEKADVVRLLGVAVREWPLSVPVEEAFPLDRAQEAYERFRSGGKFGKIVLVP
jgi:NADPH:quinone reductase-like Zn-dependent oxidoreductase